MRQGVGTRLARRPLSDEVTDAERCRQRGRDPGSLLSTLLYSIHFSLPITTCFKNGMFQKKKKKGMFPLLLSRESQVEIWLRKWFGYVEPKHQSDENNQTGTNDFWDLIWLFWACCLSPMWYNIDCSQLMSWFDCYKLQLVYLTVEHHPVRNLQHKTSQTTFNTFNQSKHVLHTLPKLFVFPLRFYLSWNNKASYAENVPFFFHLQYLDGYVKIHQSW